MNEIKKCLLHTQRDIKELSKEVQNNGDETKKLEE